MEEKSKTRKIGDLKIFDPTNKGKIKLQSYLEQKSVHTAVLRT